MFMAVVKTIISPAESLPNLPNNFVLQCRSYLGNNLLYINDLLGNYQSDK